MHARCGHRSSKAGARALLLVFALTAIIGTQVAASASNGITIDPATNDLVLREGDTFSEMLLVDVPAGATVPAADVYFLMDTTGSMAGPINSMKAAATTVMNGLVAAFPDVDLAFGAGDFKDFQSPFQFDPYAFRHQVSLTDGIAAVQTAIDAWFASGGNDIPEGQFYAYDQLAENRAPSNDGSPAGTIGWRPDAKRILVVFGDAAAHDPVCSAITAQVPGHGVPYDITEATVTTKLVDAGITFIGISTTTGLVGGMDSDPGVFGGDYLAACGSEGGTPGQATRIAEATGGAHLVDVPTAEIVDAVNAEVATAVATLNSLRLVPTGDIVPFVTSIDPDEFIGPFSSSEPWTFVFDVDFEGVIPATDTDQVFTGTIDAVADGVVVAQKQVTITVPALSLIEPVCTDLLAGQHIPVGQVCVINDDDHLTVTYMTSGGWMLHETHLHVADGAGAVPQNRAGNPTPGRFAYSGTHAPDVDEVEYTVPLAGLGEADDVLAIAAHAVVVRDGRESAWGAGQRFVPSGNWATYFTYTIQ